MNRDSVKQHVYRAAFGVNPGLTFQIQHLRMHRRFGTHWYWANIRNPATFNEKLLYSKLLGEHRQCGPLVDKELAKRWAGARIGSEYIIETFSVFKEVRQSVLGGLPVPCILKPTHSSGRVLVLRDRAQRTSPLTVKTVAEWLRINHFFLSGEPQYRDLEPKVICERLLGSQDGAINDYKMFCFGGEPKLIQVDTDRFTNHKRAFFDPSWTKQPFGLRYPPPERSVRKPRHLDEMLGCAQVLSRGFAFVRIDFYEYRDRVFFGEVTFHPESGLAPFTSYSDDLRLGQWL